MCSVLNLELKLKSAYASPARVAGFGLAHAFTLKEMMLAFASTTAGIVITHLLILQLNGKLNH